MAPLDWFIVGSFLSALSVVALSTKRYVRSVGAFLAANRCGGRYLITVAHNAAGIGVITLVTYFEIGYQAGYTSIWWGNMTEPALIVLALSGWVVYRFRQTRAMTLAQFFELRYSRRFRVFAGVVAYAGGIINFGIFPSVGARFFMALCQLPEHFTLLGFECSTYVAIMAGLLSCSIVFTFAGGLIAVMVTDFLQGVFGNVVFIVVMIFLLVTIPWATIGEQLLAAPADESLVHPMHIQGQSDFNLWYYMISVVIVFYGVLGWQGTQGYNCCAKSAHEAKMAGILNGWRFRVFMLVTIVIPIVVRAVLGDDAFAEQVAPARAALDGLDDETMRNQLRVPTVLRCLLPTGLLGLMCAAMLAAFVSTHDTYLHSWGTILVQDVILPFRTRPLTPRQHLWLLRASILCVAIFIFCFSLLFTHTQYLTMFLALTGAIFIGGAGSAIIGGLYWSRGTAAGAWAAMITGMTLSAGGIVSKQEQFAPGDDAPGIVRWFADLTGQEQSFVAIATSVAAYIAVSLLTSRKPYDLDRLLHRGAHAVGGETSVRWGDARSWWERLGISREFTGRDRVITILTVAWPLAWSALFVTGMIYNVWADVPPDSWLAFWRGWTWFVLAAAILVTVWFSIGGFHDLAYLFRNLRRAENVHEDGRVEDGHNIGEEELS